LTKKQSFLFIIFLTLALFFCSSSNIVSAQSDDVHLKIQQANDSIDQAFTAVLTAEKTGIDIASLISQLNDASDALANAENYYRNGNLEQAALESQNAASIAHQINEQAKTTNPTDNVSSQSTFWSTTTFAIIGMVVFVLALFLIWRVFKKWYIQNLSQAKPEVASQ
jgi:hypothetical protein